MSFKKLGVISTLALGMGAGMAQADMYLGANIGKATTPDWVTEAEAAQIFTDITGTVPTRSASEDSDTAFKIYAGIPVNDHLDFRFGYANLGQATASAADSSINLEFTRETQAVFVEALGKIKPTNQLALFAKLGIAYADNEMAVAAQGPGGFAEAAESSKEIVFVPGLGLAVDVTSGLGLTLEYERYLDVGDDNTGEGDVNLLSAGLYFRF